MLFHEVYGCYYNTVAKILALAVKEELTEERMNHIVQKNAFSESFLTIIPALNNQHWPLIYSDFHTPLKHEPTLPLTTLQKRWLKAISLDPRIKLFRVNLDDLDDVEPLFTRSDYVVFDQYNDGDPFEDEAYIIHFHRILDAIREKRKLRIKYTSRKGNHVSIICAPYQLEYSEKDDKFRLLTAFCRYGETVNLKRILSCELLEEYDPKSLVPHQKKKEFFVLELIDERNALERVLLHFAHFEKQAEKLTDHRYRVVIHYDRDDETELVIRVLSFGPLVKVTSPNTFVNLIKNRLKMQKSWELR